MTKTWYSWQVGSTAENLIWTWNVRFVSRFFLLGNLIFLFSVFAENRSVICIIRQDVFLSFKHIVFLPVPHMGCTLFLLIHYFASSELETDWLFGKLFPEPVATFVTEEKQELYCIVSFPATKGTTTRVVPTTTNNKQQARQKIHWSHKQRYLRHFCFLSRPSLKAVKRQKSQKNKRIG